MSQVLHRLKARDPKREEYIAISTKTFGDERDAHLDRVLEQEVGKIEELPSIKNGTSAFLRRTLTESGAMNETQADALTIALLTAEALRRSEYDISGGPTKEQHEIKPLLTSPYKLGVGPDFNAIDALSNLASISENLSERINLASITREGGFQYPLARDLIATIELFDQQVLDMIGGIEVSDSENVSTDNLLPPTTGTGIDITRYTPPSIKRKK
jgi:hypothetical protein